MEGRGGVKDCQWSSGCEGGLELSEVENERTDSFSSFGDGRFWSVFGSLKGTEENLFN